MSTTVEEYGTRQLPDYFNLVANALYAAFGLIFVAGLYVDWRMGGTTFIDPLVIAQEPQPNSGLFILSIIVLVAGYILSRVGDLIESYRTEKVDQTQEWTVDVGAEE